MGLIVYIVRSGPESSHLDLKIFWGEGRVAVPMWRVGPGVDEMKPNEGCVSSRNVFPGIYNFLRTKLGKPIQSRMEIADR